MNSGLSLHVGVNNIDRHSYGEGRYRTLRCCARDAEAMQDIAIRNGFSVLDTLIDGSATFAAVEAGIRAAAGSLADGGTFMFTFSGHGAQLLRGDAGTDDGYDEGLVLSDGVMKDDYINTLLRLFPESTYIIFVCDACHSRTMFEYMRGKDRRQRIDVPGQSNNEPRYKLLDTKSVDTHRALRRNLYIERDARFARERREYLAAQVVVLAACQDNQIAVEAAEHGLFTETMLSVLEQNAGRTDVSYKNVIDAIGEITGPAQIPSFVPLGPDPNSPFFQEFPFTLSRTLS